MCNHKRDATYLVKAGYDPANGQPVYMTRVLRNVSALVIHTAHHYKCTVCNELLLISEVEEIN